MNNILDIFNTKPFSLVEMIKAIEHRPFVPNVLDGMGIFTEKRIRTQDVAIDFSQRGVKVLATVPRGGALPTLDDRQKMIRKYSSTRVGESSRLWGTDLQGLRQLGTTAMQKAVAQEVGERQSDIIDDIDTTREHRMLGAVSGLVLDKDGSTIMNWANEFRNATEMGGTGTIPTVTWNLTPANEGDFRKQAEGVIRSIRTALGGISTNKTKIMNLCAPDFYDAVKSLPEVREQYRNQERAYYVKSSSSDSTDVFDSFEYPAGMIWKDYRGTDDGTSVAVPQGTCKTFPINTKGVFLEVITPTARLDMIGKKGIRYNPLIIRDLQRNEYVDIEVTTESLFVCSAPHTLRGGDIQ